MLETIKNAAKIGMGAIWLSKENLKKLTDDLTEISKASKEEGERLFEELDRNSEEFKQKFNEQVEKAVEIALEQAGLAKKAEVEELRQKLADLEEEIRKSEVGTEQDNE